MIGSGLDAESSLIYLRARYYDPTTAQFLTRDPITAITQAPCTYAGNDPLNEDDPSGLNKCEVGANPLRWAGNAVDCASKAAKHVRAPDYISLDVPVVFPILGPVGIGPDVNITVNRDGKIYVGPGASAGLAGFAPSLRGGWLNQSTPPCDSRVDKFTSGWSATGGGTLPLFGGTVRKFV
jgi:RHS repeat-associated protein